MISKGDLVKMRLALSGGSGEQSAADLLILGTVMNYCEDEDAYIVMPRAISVPKDRVAEIETLPGDFDFDDVSMELSVGKEGSGREKPSEITHIRFSRSR